MSQSSRFPASQGPALLARGLTRDFGARRAVDGLDLSVARGECLGLLGPNGAGKSTTLRMLATLLEPSAGELLVLGMDPGLEAEALRSRLGLVPQELALYAELSGRENLRFFGELAGLSPVRARERAEWGLELAGLTERARDRVKTWSGGMKRRLNLAAALLHEPELVFLDEPTAGVDPQSKNRIFEMVESLRMGGTTLIYTSHALGEVERLCQRIVILDQGRKLAEGTLVELERLVPGRRAGALRLASAAVSDALRARSLLAEHGIPVELEEARPGLETVFLHLTGRELRDVS